MTNEEPQDEDSAEDPNSPSQAALAQIQQAKSLIHEVLTPVAPAHKKARKSGEDQNLEGESMKTGRKPRKAKTRKQK